MLQSRMPEPVLRAVSIALRRIRSGSARASLPLRRQAARNLRDQRCPFSGANPTQASSKHARVLPDMDNSGSLTVKTVLPGSLDTAMDPLWADTIASAIERPRPVLPVSRLRQ